MEEKKTTAPAEEETSAPAEAEQKADPAEKPAKKKAAPPVTTVSAGKKVRQHILFYTAIALCLAAVILVNVVASALTDRFVGMTLDITNNSAYAISEETIKVAQEIQKKVTIRFLTEKETYEALDPYCRQSTSVAYQLSRYSDGFIEVVFTDLVQNPTLMNDYPDASLQATDVIVQCGDKYNVLAKEDLFNFEGYSDYQYIVSSKAESAMASALLKVTSDVSTQIGILTDETQDDYSYLSSLLTSNNYRVFQINIGTDDIPNDINTLIAFAPTKDYSEKAVEKIRTFLKNDEHYGKSLIYISYRNKTDTPHINTLLNEYGLKLGDGLAFDMDESRLVGNSYYDGMETIFTSRLYTNSIGEQDYPVLVSLSRPVYSTNDDITTPLLQLSDKSGVCPFDADEETWEMDKAVTGNVCVMGEGLQGNAEVGLSRVIVSGSTLMWQQNYMQSQFTNQRYVMNILSALNGREDAEIRLEDKVITQYDLTLPQGQILWLGAVVFALCPLLILGAGLTVFFYRRRK